LWQFYGVRKPKQNRTRKQPTMPRRSPCPVACSLDVLGDRWTLLVVRDLMLGGSRFKDFAASPEGIPTNILSERLERLLQHGVVEQMPARDGTKRLAYRLTAKGKALRPVMEALRDWGLAWDKSTRAMAGAEPR
jgi:DNA-binding HxlR family transcriptional regulator